MDGGVHGWMGGHPDSFDPVPEIAFVITQPRQNLNPDPSLSGHHSSFVALVGTGQALSNSPATFPLLSTAHGK